MSKIIKRLGTKPVKFEFVIAFDEVKMSVDLSGVMLVRWVRGPRTSTSMEAEGKHGVFKWKKEEQGRRPTRMICTLYKNSRGLGEYQKKKSLLVVKQKIGETLLTVGEVELDLANFVSPSGESTSRMMNEAIHKCSDKKARVKFTISSRDVTKQHVDMGYEPEMSGLTGGLDEDMDYLDPDGRADYENLELASGEDEEDEESEAEEKPPEDQGATSLVPKPQILSFVSSDASVDPSAATSLSVVVPKSEPSKLTVDDPLLQTKMRELETKIWKLTKHSAKVEKELISARDEYAKHLEKLEQDVVKTNAQFEEKEKLATELSHKLEATLVDLEMETARVRSFARLLDMQRSQIEAAEAEAATFRARAGELQGRLSTTEASLKALTEQKPGMMAQLTSSKRVKELEELVVAKDQSIKFYEAQLESSDKTMIAAKESWDNSSRLLLQEISSAEAAFKKTKELLNEATSEAGHLSDVERQFKRAIADRLKMSEALTQYECTIMQKDMELQQLQLKLQAKDGVKVAPFVQSRESSLRGSMESPALSPAFRAGEEFKNTPSGSPAASSMLCIPSFALGASSPTNPFGGSLSPMTSASDDGPSSTVIHLGVVSYLSTSTTTSSSSTASSSSSSTATLSANPFSSSDPSPSSNSASSNPFSSPTSVASSIESMSSETSSNPFDLSTNPFDTPKNILPTSSSSPNLSSSNPFDSVSEAPPPTLVITTMTVPTATTTTSQTPSPSLTASLTSSITSLFRKTSKASSTAAAAAAAVASTTTSASITTSTSPTLTSSLSTPNFATLGNPSLVSQRSLSPSRSPDSALPMQSNPIGGNPPRLSLHSDSPPPGFRSSLSEDFGKPEPRRSSSAGLVRQQSDVRPTNDLLRSVSGGASADRRKRSEDFPKNVNFNFRSAPDKSGDDPAPEVPAELNKSPRSSRSLGIMFATSAEGSAAPMLADASRSPRWGMSRGMLFSSTEPGKNFELPSAEVGSPTAIATRSLASISERDDFSPTPKDEVLSPISLEKGHSRANSKPTFGSENSESLVNTIPRKSTSDDDLKLSMSPVTTASSFSFVAPQREPSPAVEAVSLPAFPSGGARRGSAGSRASKKPPPPPPGGVSTPPISFVTSRPGVEVPALPQPTKEEPFEEF